MPRHCPDCGDVVEVKRYVVPVEASADPRKRQPLSARDFLDVWECTEACGWAEDVEP
jgi:hypothetical protein